MTDRLTLRWPDPAAFSGRDGRPIRILAVSDEPDPTLDSAVTRERIGKVDFIAGAGDLEPDYLGFVADAFSAPLRYVRGNHDVGAAWSATGRALLPEPMRDGEIVTEAGVRLIGFSGSPVYNQRNMQVSALGMWFKVIGAASAAVNTPVQTRVRTSETKTSPRTPAGPLQSRDRSAGETADASDA
jgi:hypothetical protein